MRIHAELDGRRRPFLVLAGGIAVLALVAAACGGGTSGSEGTRSGTTETDAVQDEGKLTLVMDEFTFLPETLTVSAGSDLELTIVNEGGKPHELMIGLPVGGGPEWETDLFGRMEPEVMRGGSFHMEGFEHMEDEMEGEHGHHGAEIEVEPGGQVIIRMHIPEDAVGKWEMGCFLPQHYEAGMKGTMIVA